MTTLQTSSTEESVSTDYLSPTDRREWNEMLKEHQEYIKQVEDAFQATLNCHKKRIQDLKDWREASRRLVTELDYIQEEFWILQREWRASRRSRKRSKSGNGLKDENRCRPQQSIHDCAGNQQNSLQQSELPCIPDHLLCPLTHEPFVDPVVDHEGNTYEKNAIWEWLDLHETSPLTRNPLRKGQLIPNRVVKEAIHFWKASNIVHCEESLHVNDSAARYG